MSLAEYQSQTANNLLDENGGSLFDTVDARTSLAGSNKMEILLFRPFFGILLTFNALILLIPECFVWVLQWFHIMLYCRRHPRLHKLLLIYFQFVLFARAYFWLGVDERPPLFPQGLMRALTPHSHVAHDGHL